MPLSKFFSDLTIKFLEEQDQIVLDDSIKDMNDFLDKLNKFEKITNSRLVDLWQIKDTAFQPLRVSIDV